MLRGEFIRADGLVIPNNVTLAGARFILDSALRPDIADPLVPLTGFSVGLCSAVYQPDLGIEDVTEPTLATNGYARVAVARDSTGWPSSGEVNGEAYVESVPLVWAAVGGAFDQAITRLFLCLSDVAVSGDILALSAALPDELTIDTDTLEVDRTFKYRLYLR